MKGSRGYTSGKECQNKERQEMTLDSLNNMGPSLNFFIQVLEPRWKDINNKSVGQEELVSVTYTLQFAFKLDMAQTTAHPRCPSPWLSDVLLHRNGVHKDLVCFAIPQATTLLPKIDGIIRLDLTKSKKQAPKMT